MNVTWISWKSFRYRENPFLARLFPSISVKFQTYRRLKYSQVNFRDWSDACSTQKLKKTTTYHNKVRYMEYLETSVLIEYKKLLHGQNQTYLWDILEIAPAAEGLIVLPLSVVGTTHQWSLIQDSYRGRDVLSSGNQTIYLRGECHHSWWQMGVNQTHL